MSARMARPASVPPAIGPVLDECGDVMADSKIARAEIVMVCLVAGSAFAIVEEFCKVQVGDWPVPVDSPKAGCEVAAAAAVCEAFRPKPAAMRVGHPAPLHGSVAQQP